MKHSHIHIYIGMLGKCLSAICAAACGCMVLAACSHHKPASDDDSLDNLLLVADSLNNADKSSAALALQHVASYVAYDDIERLTVNMNMAQTYYYMGEVEVASQLVDDCVAYFDTAHFVNTTGQRLFMSALAWQADLLDIEGRRAEAIVKNTRAANIAHQIGEIDTYIDCMLYVCEQNMRTGQYSEAVSGLIDLRQFCSKNNREGREANVIKRLILAYIGVDDYQSATEMLQQLEQTLDMNSELDAGLVWIYRMKIANASWDASELALCVPQLKALYDDEDTQGFFKDDINDLLAYYYINTEKLDTAAHYIRNIERDGAFDGQLDYKYLVDVLWGEYYIANMQLDSVAHVIAPIDDELLRNTNIDLYRRYVYVVARLYYRQKNYAKAYENFKQHSRLADLYAKERLAHKHATQTLAFRRDTTIRAQNYRLIMQDSEAQNLGKWYVVAVILFGGVLLAIISVFLYLRISDVKQREREIAQHNDKLQREVVRQTAILRRQESELRVKQDNMRSQLYYAGNIQQSILPNLGKIQSPMVGGVFALFRPCNPVSGDFYWVNEDNGRLMMACADATGHGVPGAIVAMMYSTMLNNLSNIKTDQPTVTMLNQLDDKINALLDNNESLLENDCIDISMLCIDSVQHTVTLSLARHNAYVVRHGHNTVERIVGTRRSVGDRQETFRLRPFIEHELHLQAGDMLYLTTDGYESQIGGPDNKKMRRLDMENLLGKIAHLDVVAQRQELENYAIAWQGQNEQTDDVLLMGIRFNT